MNFFVLAWAHWEDYVPYFFSGPDMTEEEFEKLCVSLAPQAGRNVIAEEKNREYTCYIGWHEVVTAIIPLLEEKGFTHLKPKRAVFSGSGIIDSSESDSLGDAAELVLQHNAQARDEMDKDLEGVVGMSVNSKQ